MSTRIFFIILAIMVIVAGSTALFHKNKIDSESPVCSQEALICPDGTSVARAGAQCTFAACPNQPSYTGKLVQQGDQFVLAVEASAGSQAASYSLPLELRVSNVVGQIVNQQVKVTGSFTTGNTYHVDNLEEVPVDTAGTTTIGVGETGFVNGVSITLNKIVQDSRCPVDVQCIQAGTVTANVTLKSDTDKETVTFDSSKAAHGFDSYQVSMMAIAPSRVAAHAPDPSSYKITFKVEENNDAMFSGTITAYSTGCYADGICSVTVDGKVVIVTAGFRMNGAPTQLGTLQGVASIGDVEHKIGKKATVFAHKNSPTEYTLYGNSAYYVKVQ